jgi:hypothetical protein
VDFFVVVFGVGAIVAVWLLAACGTLAKISTCASGPPASARAGSVLGSSGVVPIP